jgi:hypothetical protein
MGRTVEFRRDRDGIWLFGRGERHINGASELITFDDDLDKCTATDLQAALRLSRAYLGDDYLVPVLVALDDEEDYIDEEHSLVQGPSFHLRNGALTIPLSFTFWGEHHRDLSQIVRATLEPLLERHRLTIVECELRETFRRRPYRLVDTVISFNTRERTLRELFDFGRDAEALVERYTGPLTRETARDLIRGGHASVLIGQPEGHWLEAKRQHYDLRKGGAGQIRLAESVAKFANAELGGLIVVGMSTKSLPDGDYIRKLSPMPRNKGVLRQYHQALKEHLFPPPDNLTIEPIEVPDNGMLILIDVPPQPEELNPFLVHGDSWTASSREHSSALCAGEVNRPYQSPCR